MKTINYPELKDLLAIAAGFITFATFYFKELSGALLLAIGIPLLVTLLYRLRYGAKLPQGR